MLRLALPSVLVPSGFVVGKVKQLAAMSCRPPIGRGTWRLHPFTTFGTSYGAVPLKPSWSPVIVGVKGSPFCARNMPANCQPLIAASAPSSANLHRRRMRILIVEDEPKLAAFVKRGLVAERYA